MTITINGTSGVTSVDGSTSVPSYTGTDTDTGLYFPAANQLSLVTGAAAALTVDSTQNIKLATAGTNIQNSSGRPILKQTGSVLQIVQATFATQFSTSSTSQVSTGITASITPSTTSSQVLVLVTVGAAYVNAGSQGAFYLWRGASQITGFFAQIYGNASAVESNNSFNYLDSPASSSSVTYTVYYAASSGTVYGSTNNANSSIILMEIAG